MTAMNTRNMRKANEANSGPFNQESALRGMKAVHTNARYEQSRNTIGDLLSDLIHHAAAEGIDFEKELEFAYRDYGDSIAPGAGAYPEAVLAERVQRLATLLLPSHRENLAKVLKRTISK